MQFPQIFAETEFKMLQVIIGRENVSKRKITHIFTGEEWSFK